MSGDLTSSSQPADWQVVLVLGGAVDDVRLLALKTGLEEESIIACLHLDNQSLQQALRSPLESAELETLMETHLPDLVLLMGDELSAEGVSVSALCADLREMTQMHRAVLVVYTSGDEAARVAFLTQGADDVLASTLSAVELKVRLLVHLRRNLDAQAHPVTKLPGLSFVSKILSRRIHQQQSSDDSPQPWAMLLIGIDHLEAYQESYGQLPTNQVLRAFLAMLSRAVLMPDCMAQTESGDFIVVTQADKAVKIAALLCRQFEAAVSNFYSEKDRKQGYMISLPDEKISRRIPFLSLSIGVVTYKTQPNSSFMGVYQTAVSMRDLARLSAGNSWSVDSPQLCGEQARLAGEVPRILIVESDAALAFLLKTTLGMDGYQVEAVSSPQEAQRFLATTACQLVILDAMLEGDVGIETPSRIAKEVLSGLLLCRTIKDQHPDMAVVCVSTLHQRDRVLRAGADLYLPKPFEMSALFLWVSRLLEGHR